MGEAFRSPKSMRRLPNKYSSQANAVFVRSSFISSICEKAHGKSMLVKIFSLPFPERHSFILGSGNAFSNVTTFSGRKSQQKQRWLVFLFTMTIPMRTASKKVVSDLGSTSVAPPNWLLPPCWGTFSRPL